MPSKFQTGDAVAVVGGIFKGFTGTVGESHEEGVLVVTIKIFGHPTQSTLRGFIRPKGPNDFDPPSQRLHDLRGTAHFSDARPRSKDTTEDYTA